MFDLFFQWITGKGPRHQKFKKGDPLTKLFSKNSNVSAAKRAMTKLVEHGQTAAGNYSYSVGGADGVGKYIGDYSTLADGGLTGNHAVTSIGSYNMTVPPSRITSSSAALTFDATNTSTLAFAVHPPLLCRSCNLGEGQQIPVHSTGSLVKIDFELQVEDDWPPVGVESVWARPVDNDLRFMVESIPFFVRDLAWGDIVSATSAHDGRLVAHGVPTDGGHSTIRIILRNGMDVAECVSQVEKFGCDVEVSPFDGLLAVDVPSSTSYLELRSWLRDQAEAGRIDYEESKISG